MTQIKLEAIREAKERVSSHLVRTQLSRSETLSSETGCDLALKYENHQFTASFKERGALNKLLLLTDEQREHGVVAASAGNHAQALARHGQLLGIPVHVVMPKFTPNTKVENTKVFGAKVTIQGENVDGSMNLARDLAKEYSYTLVHPFDDINVIEGQGTLGLELLEQDPTIETIVVPIGGGGLASGIASAVKQVNPTVRVIGVQVDTFNTAYAQFHGMEATEERSALTIAEGIAVKRPGAVTRPLLMSLLDEIVQVSEQQIESAIFTLLEIEKTVVEGAGAAALAAVTAYPDIAKGRTALIVSGGNIEMITLSAVLQRGLVRKSRLVRMRVIMPDVPGSLAKLAQHLGLLDSNIVDIVHRRTSHSSTIGAQPLDIVVHLCGEEESEFVVGSLRRQGYDAKILVD
ncbi:MAG: threonine ammonia-lyase [Gammaproteobacteria bacterium]|nr:threonine ammonia-lyase [Gammaproteobacteria bacterium]MYD79937.1 threonine ammonia-lyase [Gammaproteobacteria bacterium]